MTFLLQFFVVIFSLCAAMFWFSSAIGRTVTPPWRDSQPVPPADLPAHQAKWNAWAAFCAAIAALAQAVLFLSDHYSSLFHGGPFGP